MPFYTRTGDSGQTDLLGERVTKDDPRIDLIGTLDETTSAIGLVRAHAQASASNEALIAAQRDLYTLMAELAFTQGIAQQKWHITQAEVDRIERETDAFEAAVNLPPHFILPGDSVAGAALDVARTVARRAERQAVALHAGGHAVSATALAYLNRLSSLLFIVARAEDAAAGVTPLPAKETTGGRGVQSGAE